MPLFNKICELLAADPEQLETGLTKKVTVIIKEKSVKRYSTIEAATIVRNSFAKELYNKYIINN